MGDFVIDAVELKKLVSINAAKSGTYLQATERDHLKN